MELTQDEIGELMARTGLWHAAGWQERIDEDQPATPTARSPVAIIAVVAIAVLGASRLVGSRLHPVASET